MNQKHHCRNVKRLPEILDHKQENPAPELLQAKREKAELLQLIIDEKL